MRILTITNLYPPHHYGGYELSCRDVMDRFVARGHDVTVLTSTARVPGVDDAHDESRDRVRRELRIYWDDNVLLSPPRLERLRIERANQRALSDALKAAEPDVVSVWNMGAMSLGLLSTIVERRLPTVFVVCDDWLVYAPDLDAWYRMFRHRPRLARLVRTVTGVPASLSDLGQAGAFCFVSEFIRRRAREHSGFTFPLSTVVYSGIEREEFAGDRDDEPRLWRWRLLYVGRLDPRKGLETLVRALALLPPQATLDVLGRGEAGFAASLRRLVQQLGLDDRVRFDVVDRPALRSRYADADAVVFPTEWDEPFGLVPLEAMACGTPVVATGTGGSGEFLVDGHNCLRFEAGDPPSLAAALERLAGDPQLRSRLSGAGFTTAAAFDTDRLADALESWHRFAADRFGTPRPSDRAPMSELG